MKKRKVVSKAGKRPPAFVRAGLSGFEPNGQAGQDASNKSFSDSALTFREKKEGGELPKPPTIRF